MYLELAVLKRAVHGELAFTLLDTSLHHLPSTSQVPNLHGA